MAGETSEEYPRSLRLGSGDSMHTQGKRTQHGKPLGVVGDDQPDAREGLAGARLGVAERSVVSGKPGNAGGGKGPQFKVGAGSGEVQEIEETLGNSVKVREVLQAEVKEDPGH
jgi:hypothetical protein